MYKMYCIIAIFHWVILYIITLLWNYYMSDLSLIIHSINKGSRETNKQTKSNKMLLYFAFCDKMIYDKIR